MKTGVNIRFTNDRTGTATSADGVALLCVAAAAVEDTFELETLYKLSQLSDLETLGIGDDYDETNGSSLVRQVTEFYDAAGDGAVLYLIGTDSTMSDFVAGDTFESLLRSTAYSNEGNPSPADRARMLGIVFAPQAEAGEGSYYEDVLPTATALNNKLSTLWDNGFRAFAVVDGNNLKSIGDAPDFNTQGCSRVAIHDTTATKDSCASVGLVLGILAREEVNYELSNVSAGALPISGAWFTDGTPVSTVLPAQFDTLGEKQHLFIRTRDTKSGYYFNDGATAEDMTLALSTIPANRVLNKIGDYLHSYLTDIIGQTPPLNSDGDIDAGYLSAIEEGFYTTYTDVMITDGEISNVNLELSSKSVFASTRTVNAHLSIQQRPGIAWIEADIEFVNSL